MNMATILVDMMVDYIFSYNITIDRENHSNITGKQLRAIFTTWCIYTDTECDTNNCDDLLRCLWDKMEVREFTFEDFEKFMVADII